MSKPKSAISSLSPSKEMMDLKSLMRQRTVAKTSIVRIKTGLLEKTMSLDPIELECRLDILNSHSEKLMKCQSKIEEIDEEDIARGELEDLIVETKSIIKSILARNKSSIAETSFTAPHSSRLPKMSLPTFKGEYSEFKNFMSLFESFVHNDPTIPDIEKFNHLVSCLSGEALGTVKSFQMSEENYPKALASLRKVYDNKCLIFFNTVSKLFELSKIQRPSASSLRSMIDTVSAVYDSLLSLGDDKLISNAMLIHIVMSKVDPTTRSKWEEQLDYDKLPLWAECEAMLNKRYQHLSAEEASSSQQRPNNEDTRQKTKNQQLRHSKTTFIATNSKLPTCLHCGSKDHYLTACPKFQALTALKRFELAKSISLCINCLRKGHTVSKCKADRCGVCNRSHHTMLHQYPISFETEPQPSTSQAMHISSLPDRVMLATAVVNVKASSGVYVQARALLDSGSQVQGKLKTYIKSRINNFEFSADFWVMRSISVNHPDRAVNTNGWKIPQNIELADPSFYKCQKIDILLGAEIFFDLLSVGQIRTSPRQPTLQKTVLGWIISGKYATNNSSSAQVSSTLCQFEENVASIDTTIRKFWELEEIPAQINSTRLTPEQAKCEEFFSKTTQVLPCGRLQVRLPFKTDRKLLGHSYETAARRFQALERRTLKDPVLRKMYLDFMQEYLELGHMSPTNNRLPSEPHYFIPHQCVLRPQSTTTKLRVVFDASSRTSTQVALNETLMVGPIVQEELFSTLLRFRLHKYAMTADITKMYRQILVHEDDRNFQLIVWRQDPSEHLQIFRLNTVTYGTAPAPFLATRCLQMLSDKNKAKYPLGSKVIRNDFYVDDLLTGSDSIESLTQIQQEVNIILESAGLKLAKWFSNHTSSSNSESLQKLLQLSDTDSTKTLGIHWQPKDDIFRFILEDNFSELRATKRNILSVSARLFDPLGLLAPLVTKAKILLQELWIQKLDWDESIPLRLDTSWQNFKANLLQLPSISIPRFIGRRGMPAKIYCDNATNFVGAERKLRELREAFLAQKEEILQYAADEGFIVAFIPPRAPHFGGLWEAAVKSAKHLLVRAVGNALLTAEESATLLVEVEAVLNSRPLAPLSNDPNDGEALTPAHLLIGCPLRALPPEKVPVNLSRCLERWQLVCSLKQQFWRAWSKSYLLELQQRNKWVHPQPNVQPGQLVVVHEDNVPPQHWVLGRVTATIPGADGKIRVADITTRSGEVRRPIHKLAVLPVESKN
ncbi:uncharacterized protein LOC128867266 [Anastrepha ludens]|uniref:uncharacterized protein LOC128867266 n=1 Tax=Anastrepha ludens TaxID=28586 RepID=UPI0023B09CB6|nr:uncharacterized protein LOC128867266 [Anastrepha ludens]